MTRFSVGVLVFCTVAALELAAPLPARAGAGEAGTGQASTSAVSGSLPPDAAEFWSPPRFDFGQVITAPAGPPPTPRHTGIKAMVKALVVDVKHLPSRQNLFWVGIGSGLALGAHPLDDNVQRYMVDNDTAKNIFKAGSVLGQTPTLLGSAVAVYAIGRLKDEPRVSHVGMDLIEALAVSEGMTEVLKITTRRERPDHSSRNSFPSGHASGTFAFATALERHIGWRFAVPAYAFASYVAISRLPDNRHWLSDVIFGASVGIIAGRTVTRHGRENYPVEVAFVPGGAAIIYAARR
jgi:membrane-associated phospholipid phosphatase